MNRRERIEGLRHRAETERESLAKGVSELRSELTHRRSQWKIASWIAGVLAAGGTVFYKLFGRSSYAAKIGRMASLLSLALGLGRAVRRIRRFF